MRYCSRKQKGDIDQPQVTVLRTEIRKEHFKCMLRLYFRYSSGYDLSENVYEKVPI